MDYRFFYFGSRTSRTLFGELWLIVAVRDFVCGICLFLRSRFSRRESVLACHFRDYLWEFACLVCDQGLCFLEYVSAGLHGLVTRNLFSTDRTQGLIVRILLVHFIRDFAREACFFINFRDYVREFCSVLQFHGSSLREFVWIVLRFEYHLFKIQKSLSLYHYQSCFTLPLSPSFTLLSQPHPTIVPFLFHFTSFHVGTHEPSC